jgi:Ca-activated chloride channel family protein
VFAVKKPVAEKLGWVDHDVRVQDILAAAEDGHLRFAMTSATQSNSGASAYLGYVHAFANNPEVLTEAHLQDAAVQEKIKRFLGKVHRQTGSPGWLMELLLEHYDQFDAMVNYEALVIEANQQLVKRGAT